MLFALLPLANLAAPLKPLLITANKASLNGGFILHENEKYPIYVDSVGQSESDVYIPLTNGSYQHLARLDVGLTWGTRPCKGCPSAFGSQITSRGFYVQGYDFTSKTPKKPMFNITYPKLFDDWPPVCNEDGSLLGWAKAPKNGHVGQSLIYDGLTGNFIRNTTVPDSGLACVQSYCGILLPDFTQKWAIMYQADGEWTINYYFQVVDTTTGQLGPLVQTDNPGLAIDGQVFYGHPGTQRTKYHFNIAKNITTKILLGKEEEVVDFQPRKSSAMVMNRKMGEVKRWDLMKKTMSSVLLHFNTSAETVFGVNDPYVFKVSQLATGPMSVYNLDTKTETQLERRFQFVDEVFHFTQGDGNMVGIYGHDKGKPSFGTVFRV